MISRRRRNIHSITNDIMGAAFISILTVALVAGLYYLIIGKLVRGLRCFSRFAGQWKSEDEQKVNIMKSLGLVSGGLANLLIFLTIVPLIIGLIIAIIPK